MEKLKRAAIIAELVDKLKKRGSWCGETHIQKAAYFLQGLLDVPTGFNFILYKHGPFSFDLRDELNSMLADDILELEVQPAPYGPSFVTSRASNVVRKHYPKTVSRYRKQLDVVSNRLGPKNVGELEQLATALYFTLKHPKWPAERRAKAIADIKPHIRIEEAKQAVGEIGTLIKDIRK